MLSVPYEKEKSYIPTFQTEEKKTNSYKALAEANNS